MNIASLLTQATAAYPDNTAIVQGGYRLSYLKFEARVNRLANALQKRGVRAHDHIALWMTNGPQMLEAMFAAFKLGAGLVPINFRLHPHEIAYIIDNSQASTLFTTEEFDKSVSDIRDLILGVQHFITTGPTSKESHNYESLLAEEEESFSDVDVHPDDVAWLFYTSGTTGRPKGAMLTHQNLWGMTDRFYSDICPNFSESEVVLHAAPLSHGSGLYALPNMGKAATHVFLESASFDPQIALETIAAQNVTNLFAAPAMIKRFVDCPTIDQTDTSSLQALIWGGAPMMVEDLQQAIVKFPNMVQIYGLGETPMTITYLPSCDHLLEGSEQQIKRLGSAGICRSEVEVAIVDDQDGFLATGEKGEIVTRSDVMTKGYWRDPEATATTLRNGWLHTGDIGYFDEDGYLFLMDRSKDLIISGGENIYPREIEEILAQHPAVKEVAVIGVPDSDWGEAIKAVVSRNQGQQVTEDELIGYCKSRIASYKKPKSVDFVAALPRNNYGKILKRELRAPYWQDRDRHI